VSIEARGGQARPTPPRSSDLSPQPRRVPPPPNPGNRFKPGNKIAEGHGWKATVRRMLPVSVASNEAVLAVARDSMVLYRHVLRELAHDGPAVRALVADIARCWSVSARYHAAALEADLTSDRGMKLADAALRHSQRAERLLVTALDVSGVLATARSKRKPLDLEQLNREAEEAARRARAPAGEPEPGPEPEVVEAPDYPTE